MITAESVYIGNLRTRAKHVLSGSEILTDAPPDNQGEGAFFSPTDLVATALGSCMITIMGIVAKRDGFSIDGTTWKVTKIMGDNPRRIAEIIIELHFPHNNYSEKERRLIEHSVKYCPVAQSLHPDLKQTIIYHYGQD
jgi:putative redox protein